MQEHLVVLKQMEEAGKKEELHKQQLEDQANELASKHMTLQQLHQQAVNDLLAKVKVTAPVNVMMFLSVTYKSQHSKKFVWTLFLDSRPFNR